MHHSIATLGLVVSLVLWSALIFFPAVLQSHVEHNTLHSRLSLNACVNTVLVGIPPRASRRQLCGTMLAALKGPGAAIL